jgi:putative addiction module killer protein
VVEVLEYNDVRGRNPFRNWLLSLDVGVRARILAAVLRLEGGNFSNAKGAGSGVLELRLDFGPGYRVYFAKDGEQLVILLGGGDKKRQQRDIQAAQALWVEYKRRKRED